MPLPEKEDPIERAEWELQVAENQVRLALCKREDKVRDMGHDELIRDKVERTMFIRIERFKEEEARIKRDQAEIRRLSEEKKRLYELEEDAGSMWEDGAA